MSFNQLIRRTALIAVAALATSAMAGETGSLTVTATVTGTCKLTNVDPMSFTLDGALPGDGAASSKVSIKCTKGTALGEFKVGGKLASDGGYDAAAAGNPLTNGSETIPYSITWTAPSGVGSGIGPTGTAIDVTLNGTILRAAFLDVTPGSYSGAVSVSIAP